MSGKVVLITGASSGIGKATAALLLSRGYTVYCAARRTHRMQELEQRGARLLRMDLTEEPSVREAVEQLLQEQGRVDVLFNNAGYGTYGAVEDVPLAEARRQFEVNLFGLGYLTQLILPQMRAQRSGLIINNSSMAGRVYTPMGAWYHAAKHALEGYSDSLRTEVAPYGIRVVVIRPGIIESEWAEIMLQHLQQHSGQTDYAPLARAVAQMLDRLGHRPSPPQAVAEKVLKIIQSRNPRSRYAVGRWARPLLLGRWLLPDRLYDRILFVLLGTVGRTRT